MSDPGPTVFWHRRDLRLEDNRGLREAAGSGTVAPVLVLDPEIRAPAGAARDGFYVASAAALQRQYRAIGADLTIRVGDPRSEIPAVVAETGADRLVYNADYSKLATRRDRDVEEAVPTGVESVAVPDLAAHEPGSIRTTAGDHYSVFSYYYKKWADRDPGTPIVAPEGSSFLETTARDVHDVAGSVPEELPIPAGRRAALDRLDRFLDGPIFEYAEARDVPSAEGTSRLSQDLSMGLLGIREVIQAVNEAETRAESGAERDSVEEFRRQLGWRDFYLQVLAAHPETVTENFKDYENPIAWRDAPEDLAAWKRGETGYPIVDAGMRQLQAEGYMHNRVRMIVAAFLTKDLQIDWREGYRHFRANLIDHDTANDVGGWQWAASTGTDAQPYFRVFNPMTQGERYDPEASYITTYVTELDGVDPEAIHSWPDLNAERREAVAAAYPGPIVDHAARRDSAISMFERARGED
ncbi:MAG: cryptochrome/photolyase family protein [Halodesulfurarchaeum sp.]